MIKAEHQTRPQKLYRWTIATSSDDRAVLLEGVAAPGETACVRSGSLVSFEVSSLRAVDVNGRRFRLLSPRSLEAVSELKRALTDYGVQVTWHGWPYDWREEPRHSELPGVHLRAH